jgi:tripartite ATP-independent transporter DctM subunit
MSDFLVLVVSFAALLAIGVPIAFAIGISTTAAMLVSIPLGPAVTTVAQRIATGLDSFALQAIPFFLLAGQLMNRGGSAARLVAFARAVLGHFQGGLAYVNVLAAMLFAAISGSAVATASAVGGIMGPEMERDGYDREFGAAVNITSATTGLIIPPSNILIVYSLASGGVSIAALFVAGYLPGIVVGVALMIVGGLIARKRGYVTAPRATLRTTWIAFRDALPSLLLLVIVMGGIAAGVFTATEAAAVAVLYALVLAFAYRGISFADLPDILLDTAATTAVVLLLIGTSMGMSWMLAYAEVPQTLATSLVGIAHSKITILLLMNVAFLVVGMFIDITPAVLILTPIFLPITTALGVHPVHFGIVIVLNLCIGLCTPPVGSVLFVGVGVAKTSIARVIKPLLPLYAAMIVALLIVTYVPALTLWLPRMLGLL